MNLLRAYAEWKKLEFWNQFAIVTGIGGVILGILSLTGVRVDLLILSNLLLVCGVCLFAYGNIQQSRKLADVNDELDKVDSRIDQATKAVYHQKREEIDKLEADVTTWKSLASKWEGMSTDWQNETTELISICKMLLNNRNELKLEIQHLQEELQRIYDLTPELNIHKGTAYSMGYSAKQPTPSDVQIMAAINYLKELEKKHK